ncbi:MAG: CHC2 zinc finger domain-containing protein [Methylococcales bacterium]|nr:CHC2 zinc finger domain-containing protein [Methylococcales bacterium]
MTIEALLPRLDGVKKTGANRWLARCSVHEDKTPSMAVRLLDDGRILLHCFGCGANGIEIIQSLGLDPAELFPPKPVNGHGYSKERNPFNASDVLKALLHEATIINLAASDVLTGVPISEADYARITVARDRISQAVNYAR